MKKLLRINVINEMLILKNNILKVGVTISLFLCMISNIIVGGESMGFLYFLDQENIRYLIYLITFLSLFFHVCLNRELIVNKCNILTFAIYILFLFVLIGVSNNQYIDGLFRLLILFPFLFVFPICDFEIKKILSAFLYLALLISFCSSICNGPFFKGRFVTNSNDPNFSAIYALLGFMLSDKLKNKKTKFCYLLIGIATQSRNFILSIIVFYVIRKLRGSMIFDAFFYKFRPLYVFVLLQFFVVLLGWYMLLNMDFDSQNKLADGSNKLRFMYTAEGMVYLTSGKDALLDGAGPGYWSIEKGGTGTAGTTGALHNSFLSLMVEKGVFYALINLLVIFLIVDKNYIRENVEFIYSFLISTLFLGGVFSGVFLFFWCYILSVRK